VLVGEQPGDAEDRRGHPFVGPAGGVLDRTLVEAGLSRREVYLTNAVKHFKWEPRGKRRIHMKPRLSEVKACRPWLEEELSRLRPRVIVCLGTTAVQSVLGPGITTSSAKERVSDTHFGLVVVTRHHHRCYERGKKTSVKPLTRSSSTTSGAQGRLQALMCRNPN
jgi:DNA polymerase